eukprot:gene7215-19395_t
MENRSPARTTAATTVAIVFSFIVYEIMGVCGYYVLGGNASGDSLLNFNNAFHDAHPWTKEPTKIAK